MGIKNYLTTKKMNFSDIGSSISESEIKDGINCENNQSNTNVKHVQVDEKGGMLNEVHAPFNSRPKWSGARICWLVVLIIFTILSGYLMIDFVAWLGWKDFWIDNIQDALRDYDPTHEYCEKVWMYGAITISICFDISSIIWILSIFYYIKHTRLCRETVGQTTHVVHEHTPHNHYQAIV